MPLPPEVDEEGPAGAVRGATGHKAAELVTYRCESIHRPFNSATGGLYRLSGEACAEGDVVSWSLVLKMVRGRHDRVLGPACDPADANYWKRELLVYRSGILDALPGIRAPRCLGAEKLGGAGAVLWLEDVGTWLGSDWTADRYGMAARRLGEFNGAYLTGRPVPTAPFLTRRWLRTLLGGFDGAVARLASLRDHELVRRCWPDGLADRFLRVWQGRHVLLDALDRLPQTFCHLDAFPRNLAVDDRGEVIAVDWSFAGVAGVGTEIAPLVPASVWFFDLDPGRMQALGEVVFEGYVDGLRAAGWAGDDGLVRLGYTAATALHYALFPLGVLMVDDGVRERFEQALRHPAGEIADRWGEAAAFLLAYADEAGELVRAI